jgi:hypothetical protein
MRSSPIVHSAGPESITAVEGERLSFAWDREETASSLQLKLKLKLNWRQRLGVSLFQFRIWVDRIRESGQEQG